MRDFVRFWLRIAFRCMKVRVRFDAPVSELAGKGIYISNHVSFLDPVILFAFLPNNPIFALHGQLYRNKFVRFLMKTADVMSFDFMNPVDVKNLISKINTNRMCVVFPEGRMTDTGDLMKIYEAPCVVADKTKAPVIPIWIDGLQYGPFSETAGNLPHRPLPKVRICVGKPVPLTIDEKYRTDRDYLKNQVYLILRNKAFESLFNPDVSLFGYLIKTAKVYGKSGLFSRRPIVEDIQRKPQTYKDILLKSYVLGQIMRALSKKDENIGVMLPNTVAALCTFFGMTAFDRTPVMINFSVGSATVLSMVKTASLKTIVTSRSFIEKAELQTLVDALTAQNINVVYLEDVAKRCPLRYKLKALLLYKLKKDPSTHKGFEKAAILFTSGSEGMPKGVVLSHAGIVGNVLQTMLFEGTHLQDLMFNSLPMFHSMGLTVGCFFPMFQGAKVFLFPSPLKHRIISELLYELGATVMLATDTFYRSYAKLSHPYDFRKVRLCYAGAEAVKADTRQLVLEKLGIRLMEAYGTTECSPVLCANNQIFNKFGTIGQLVPGVEYKLEPVQGIEKGGELCVKGPNVMLGYLFYDKPEELVPPKDGWYHTGDVVEIDGIGFVKIKDRVKRFAKVGGEMISLTAVENIAKTMYVKEDEFFCGAVSLPHMTKGEQIILVSNRQITSAAFSAAVHAAGLSQLYAPSQFMFKEDMPILGTGKTDFVSLKKWVIENQEKA